MRVASLCLFPIAGLCAGRDPPGPTPSFDWDAVTPSRNLEYHDCYAAYKCARLLLPLDWKNSSDARTVALAVIKLPAVVPDSHPAFAGSIFTNPGGPGGSGVDFALASARRLQRIADKPGRRHYEIVSFDPRGMANSRPRANCFPGDALARDAFALETRGNGAFDNSLRAVPYMLGLFDGFGRRCHQAEVDGLNGGDIMGYLSTPSVARDMVEMVDKIAELRRPAANLELRRRDADDLPRLQYIGFSYGTILGNYFASLFPERIGRLVLDGVDDAVDYSSGPGWLTNLVDADEIVANFFSGCHDAGPSVCALARAADTSVADIRARFDRWLRRIDESPLTGLSPAGAIVVVTSRDVDDLMGTIIYEPIQNFVAFARVLDDAMAGNTTAFVDHVIRAGFVPRLKESCALEKSPYVPYSGPLPEGTFSVLCTDGDSVHGKNASWWRRYVDEQVHTSSVMGANWASIRMSCSAWPFRTNWSFKGPFTTPKAQSVAGRPVKGSPAAPLLFLSNRLDPVTPLSAARAMAANHPGSGLVIQEAMGHSALVTADSSCTARFVADYLESGVVPSHEATCPIDCGPWDSNCVISAFSHTLHTPHIPRKRTFPLGLE